MAFPARFAGTCRKCSQPFAVNTMITWSRRKGHKGAWHEDCSNPTIFNHLLSPVSPEQETDRDVFETQEAEPTDKASKALEALRDLLGSEVKIDADAVAKIAREVVESALRDRGALPLTVNVVRPNLPDVKITNAHKQLPRLIALMSKRRNVYLFGPHGSGKTHGTEQAGKALGIERYGYISLTPQTPISHIVGYKDANGCYQPTPFRECFENGGVFNADEADNASATILVSLNPALDGKHMAFPDGLVKKHADFVFVATGNTSGKGGNSMYPERKPFDASFRSRFAFLEWNYDEQLEEQIALSINPEGSKWVKWLQSVRRWSLQNDPKNPPVCPRETFGVCEDMRDGDNRDVVLDNYVWRGDSDRRDKIIRNCPLPV